MEGNVDCDNNVVYLRDENNTNWTTSVSTSAIGMYRHHCHVGEDGVFGAVVVDGFDHDRTIRPWG